MTIPNPKATTPAVSSAPVEKSALRPIEVFAANLEKVRPKLAVVLPSHIPVERFERVVMTAVNTTPALLAADRHSLFVSCTRAATDGLLPDGREGALVAFRDRKTNRDVVQWMPMVFGIVKKLRQSGEVASITSRVVFQNEIDQGRFRYLISEGRETLTHEPILVGERGDRALVYASATFKDGTVQHEVLTKADVEKARAVSRSGDSEYGPWKRWTDDMWRKTAIRKLSKLLPLSAEDRRLIERDDATTEFAEMREAAKSSTQSIESAARALGAAPAIAAPDEDEADFDGVIDQDFVEAMPVDPTP